MAGDVPEDADDAAGWQGCFRVVEFGRERHPQLSGHGDEGGYQALAQAAQGLADHLGVPPSIRVEDAPWGPPSFPGHGAVARENT